MSDYTMVRFGQMESGRADFIAIYNAFQETLSTMDGQLRGNLSRWDGQAQQAYYAAKAIWDAAAADMANVINQLGTVIGVANTTYQGTEANNAALWA